MKAMSVAVLCGGRSSRMGRDKAGLPFGGESMLARAVHAVSQVSDDVMVVGPLAATAAAHARHISDPGEGPLVALTTALRSAREGRVLLLACDMPLVTPALLGHLRTLAGDSDACVPRVGGVAVPTCAIYRRDIVDVAETLVSRGARSLRALLETVRVRWVDESELRAADPDLHSFIDCDTPEAYARAHFDLAVPGGLRDVLVRNGHILGCYGRDADEGRGETHAVIPVAWLASRGEQCEDEGRRCTQRRCKAGRDESTHDCLTPQQPLHAATLVTLQRRQSLHTIENVCKGAMLHSASRKGAATRW